MKKEYLKILLAHFLVMGSFTGLAGILSFLLTPFGMTATDTAIVIIMAPPGGKNYLKLIFFIYN